MISVLTVAVIRLEHKASLVCALKRLPIFCRILIILLSLGRSVTALLVFTIIFPLPVVMSAPFPLFHCTRVLLV